MGLFRQAISPLFLLLKNELLAQAAHELEAIFIGQWYVLAKIWWTAHQHSKNWGQIPIQENTSIQPLEYVQLKLLFLDHECSIGW